MTEGSPIYSVEPSEPEDIEKGASLLASGVLGIGLGVTVWLSGNPETAVTAELSIGGLSLGILFSMDSGRRASYAARTGRRITAYLREAESSLEGTFAGAVTGAVVGYQIGGVEGAILTGAAGGVAGGLVALAILKPNLSQAFRERNQTLKVT